MAAPTNILQTVQTYQKAELAWLLNEYVAINLFNKKFKDFQDKTANLGDSITFDTTPRYITYNGLVITNQPSVQRVQTLVCSQASNVAAAYTDQQFIFNVREYMDRFGIAAMTELGTRIESDILRNIVTGVRINNPQSSSFGAVQVDSGPFTFYGDGVTQINSFTQLAQAIANFTSRGYARENLIGILPVTAIPSIVGTGLQQFAQSRNDRMSKTWQLGEFAGCDWYISNLLPTHTSGSIGDTAAPNNIMTVVSTNDPTGANITQISFTEPTGGTDANAIKIGDMFQFNDGVSSLPNMRALTFIGHEVTDQPVQFVATADAATVAGAVTVTVRTIVGTGLVSAQNQNQNINNTIQAGMKVTPLPSHRAGVLMSGNQSYLAMPQLPDQSPFVTSNMVDPETGASIRHYYGTQFGQNVRSYVRDSIWGSTMVPENCMRLIFPM